MWYSLPEKNSFFHSSFFLPMLPFDFLVFSPLFFLCLSSPLCFICHSKGIFLKTTVICISSLNGEILYTVYSIKIMFSHRILQTKNIFISHFPLLKLSLLHVTNIRYSLGFNRSCLPYLNS